MYIWKRYSVVTTKTYVEKQESGTYQIDFYLWGAYRSKYYGNTYTFDASTGKYTITDAEKGSSYSTAKNKNYITEDASNNTYMYGGTKSTIVGFDQQSVECSIRYSAELSTSYSKGNYLCDVQSNTASAYPADGKHTDGYWYVLQNYTEIGGGSGSIGSSSGNSKLYASVNPIIPRTLPNGYTQVEYIESTGTQRINTGVKPNQDTRIVVSFDIDDSVSGESHIASVRSSSGSSPFYTLYYDNSAWGTRYGTQAIKTSTTIKTKTRHIFDKNKNITTIDGSETITVNYETFSSTTDLPLFCRADGTTYNSYIKGKLYFCQIYDNGTLVRDFVPCTDPTSVVGLYDVVNNKFYPSSSSTHFIAGDSYTGTYKQIDKLYASIDNFTPRDLPSGYTQVAYLQSSGTQYIDTKFYPTYKSRVVVDVSNMPTTLGFVFGTRNESVAAASLMFNFYRTTNKIRSDYFGTNAEYSLVDASPRTIIDKNRNVTTAFGVTLTNTAVSSGVCNHPLFLFGLNNGGTASSFYSFRMYSCKIYDNDVLVRDYVPCKNSSGTLGLYDLVNNQFYTNAGTGTFTAGTTEAKTAYKQISKLYAEINGYYRKIFGGGELVYKGCNLVSVSAVTNVAAEATKNHALVIGGAGAWNNTSTGRTTVYAISKNLTVSNAPELQIKNLDTKHGAINGNAIIADYYDERMFSYDENLTKRLIVDCGNGSTIPAINASGTSTSNHLIFPAFHRTTSTTIDNKYMLIFDSNLTVSYQPTHRQRSASSVSFNGCIVEQQYNGATLYVMDDNLTETILAAQFTGGSVRTNKTVVGDYVLFAGGLYDDWDEEYGSYTGSSSIVNALDSNWTIKALSDNSNVAGDRNTLSMGDYGVYISGSPNNTKITVYDTTLTVFLQTNSTYWKDCTEGVVLGKYGFVPAGRGSTANQSGYSATSTVEVFAIE